MHLYFDAGAFGLVRILRLSSSFHLSGRASLPGGDESKLKGYPLRTRIVLVATLLVASGCGGDGKTTAGMNDDLRYERGGGFAGVYEQLVVNPDGRASLIVRGHEEQNFNLSEEELNSLTAALDEANLEDLPSDSTSGQPAPDTFSYSLSYQDKRIMTDDPSIPSDLKPLLSELNRIVENHRSD